VTLRLVSATVVLLTVTWACLALWIDGPGDPLLGAALCASFGLCTFFLMVRVRPRWRALSAYAALFLGVIGWWGSLVPRNDRNWEPSVARLAHAEISGDRITLTNVRNFHYRSETDFDPVWETRSYDLRELTGADISFTHWGSPWIAHTMVSWVFRHGPPLIISIETRKEVGESYSALRGFFRQYELVYVVGDERDLIRLRTDFRKGENVHLYHLNTPLARSRAVLLDYLRTLNELTTRPLWYNALTTNCTTTIRYHIGNVAPQRPLDWRWLANGRLPQLAYAAGSIDRSLPFEELRRRSWINPKAWAADDSPDFSRLIRVGLPGYPEP